MKKFGICFLSLMLIFGAFFISACSKEYSIDFDKQYIELSIGDNVELKDITQLKNLKFEDLALSTLDSSVAVVENSKIIAVSSGSTFVKATYENASNHIEIKVLGNAISTEVPTGLAYDAQSGYIKWNPVIVRVDNKIIQANSYTLSIKQGDVVTEEKVIGENQFKLTKTGNLEIKVKCNEYKTSNKVIYRGSNYSEALVVKKLNAPYGLEYDDSTNVLTWNAEGVSSFRVKVNGVVGDVVNAKRAVIDLTSSKLDEQQTFEVSVISIDDSIQDKIVVETESEKKVFTRLFAPSMSIENGVITWDNSQLGKFHYELTITNASQEKRSISLSGGEYDCKGLDYGEYSFKLRAVSDDEMFLDSLNVVELKNIQKLQKTTLMFNPLTKVLSATNYQDKLIKIFIKYQDEQQEITLEDGAYNWQFEDVGNYVVTAMVYAKTAKEINSDLSNPLTVVQLKKVDLSTLVQSVENGKYFVEFDEEEGITYSLKVDESDGIAKQNDGSYGNVNTIFAEVKDYEVSIIASKVSSNDVYYLSSLTKINVSRQKDLELEIGLSSQDKPQSVQWEVINTCDGYDYYITKDGQNFAGDITQNNSISIVDYEYGRYSFYAKALGRIIGETLYLDSLNYSRIDFVVEYVLEAPEISFDTQTKVLTVEKVFRAENYIITFDGQNLVYDGTKENIQIDLTSRIAQEKTYVVTAQAVNNEDELILDSQETSVQITKLASPQQFTVTEQGVIIILDYPESKKLDTKKEQILINNVETTTLGEGSVFEVVAKFNGNKERVEDNYYIDSDQSTFTVQKLAKPQNVQLDETLLYWEENPNDNFVYLLSILQNSKEYALELDENEIDVFDQRFSFVDITQDFQINVKHVFIGANIDLSESTVLYYTSDESDYVNIHKIKSDINIVVSEQAGVTTIEWEESEVQDVTYTLYYLGEEIYKGGLTSFDITDICSMAGDYTFRLKITKQGYIASEYVEAYVKRLALPQSITIDGQENVIVSVDYTDEQLERIVITHNGDEITNLSEINGNFEIQVKLVAKVYDEGYYYYLDSDTQTFKFSRLTTINKPIVEDNVVTYDKIVEIDKYQLKFSNGEDYYTLAYEQFVPILVKHLSQQKKAFICSIKMCLQ